MSVKTPVWSWRDAILKADAAPATKLVCHTIACHLSDAGKGWRITVEQLARETGMKDRAVRTHLLKAGKSGLLEIKRHHDGRGHRTATEYCPRFPDGVELSRQAAVMGSLPANSASRAYRQNLPVAKSAGQEAFQEYQPKKEISPHRYRGKEGVDVLTCGGNA